jgi:hypothetical protein
VGTNQTNRALGTPAASRLNLGGFAASYDELAVYAAALSPDRVDADRTAAESKGASCAPSANWSYAQTVGPWSRPGPVEVKYQRFRGDVISRKVEGAKHYPSSTRTTIDVM